MGPWWWLLLWCLHAVLVHNTLLTGGQRPQERPLQPAGWSPASSSSWAPTPEPGASGDPEGSAAAMAFLQTGDAQRLARANCSRGVAARAAGAGPPPALRAALRAAPEALAHTANFLNMLFQTNDIREASVAEDVEWYQALVRSLAEGHPWVRRAVLALDAHPLAAKPRLMLQATKGEGEILLQDVSAAAPSLGNLSWDNEWFNAFKSQRTPPLRKRLLSNDLSSMDTPKWQRGDSYVGEPGHVRWSPPFLECRDGRFLPAWVVTLSSAFYGLKPDLSPEFKGVVRVDIELRDVAIDQCASGPGWFADTHRCDLNSTQESRGFVLGRYVCRCKPGFYRAGGAASGAQAGADRGSRLSCWPCRQGCVTCEDDAPCLIQEDRALRAAVLSCQACCMLAVFLSMLISYHYRRSKRIRASGVVLLETILFGSLLLYFPVFILYFKPSIFRCIVLRWVRMLGFAIVYGTITLKLYRVLKVFLSRTAQRVPYVSSGRVLKMLGLILLLVLWFLAAWTIGMLENIDRNIPLVIRTQTGRGLHFYICSHDHWDYMMVIAEMLFLLWGSFLCYATRAVPSAFHEPRYMGIALHNELMISATFHVVRFIMVPSLHPDWTLLLFFAHTHGTITMTLALLFIPKFLHAGSPLREEIAAEVYEDELDMRRSGSCLNSSIASAWSEHSLDPDDIREELKKLYVQLEVHKTRRMAAHNPHLPKKRSSRRSLARSLTRRGTELPEVGARRSSGGERTGTPARHGSSAKRLPDAGGTSLRMRDEGSRHRVTTLRKSRSTEGPAREPQEGSATPGEPGPGTKVMAAMASEPSDSESLDAAPLVCKSASAHNLTGSGQLSLPRAPPLQKSLSVVAGAREEALLATSRAAWEAWHANQYPYTGQGPPKGPGKPQSPGAADALLPASSSLAKEDTSPPGSIKVQKRVTYAPIKSISVDSSHAPGRVRVAVKRTPPPPPVRYQSLGRHATPAGDSPGRAEPPTEPPAPAGEMEGTSVRPVEEDRGGTSPLVGRGRLLTAVSIPAQVCPWELVQEEILSRKQKAAEVADSDTPNDAAATPISPKPPSQKTSIRGLGLALKAFNRSRGKSILRGKREGEGSLEKKGREGGSRRERPSMAETSAVSSGAVGQDSVVTSPGSESTTSPRQGDEVPCQHNNNAGTAGAAGQWDRTGDGENLAEEPNAPRGDADAGRDVEGPSGVHDVAPSTGHQEGAEQPSERLAVAGSRKAEVCPWEGTEAPMAEPGNDAPAAVARLVTPKEGVARSDEGPEGGSGSISLQDFTKVEQPHAKRAAGSPCLSTAGVQRAAAEEPGAEVHPWGATGGRGALLRQEAVGSREDSGVPLSEESSAKVLEKRSSQPEPLGPGGSLGTKRVPPRSWSTQVAPAAVGKGSRAAGRQAELCPWEVEDEPRARTEICPWEEPAVPSAKERPSQDTQGTSKGESKPGSGALEDIKAKLAETSGHRPERRDNENSAQFIRKSQESSKAEAKKPQSVESLKAEVCPWESLGSEQPPETPRARSPALPESSSKKSQSGESLKAEICPWELESTDKAEICPWEVAAALPGEGAAPGKSSLAPKHAGASKPPEKESSKREAVCPWESLGTEQPPETRCARSPALPKSSSKKSQSGESLKAEICPWETPAPVSTDKAEICPWEVAAPPSGEEMFRQDKDGQSVVSRSPKDAGDSTSGDQEKKCRDRESVCPWESTDMEGSSSGYGTRSTELPKATTKTSESMGSLKAEVCPWESLGSEQPPETPRAGSPALPESSSKKSQSVESLKAEICPWEAPEVESTSKAEICPWEVAAAPPNQQKAKQGPGEGSKGDKRITRQAALASPVRCLEKGSSEREAICPWESLGTEQPPETPRARSPALPESSSKKSQSVESLKAEICPWELESTDKAEICPWEVAAALPGEGAAPGKSSLAPKHAGASKPLEKESSEREAVCPWESLGTEEPSLKAATGKEPSEKSHSTESRKSDVCPWEAAEPPSSQKESSKAGVHPRGAEGASTTGTGKSKPVAGASAVSPTALLKKSRGRSDGEAEHKPLCRILPSTQPPRGLGADPLPRRASTAPAAESSPSPSANVAEVCPWEAEEAPPASHRTSTETGKASKVCPWEESGDPTRESQQGRAGASPHDGARGVSETQPDVCPWDHQ